MDRTFIVELARLSALPFFLGLGALLALSKSKKHFVGLTWDYGGKKGGFAFQADKNDYRGLLAGLEDVAGKKAVDSDAMNVKNDERKRPKASAHEHVN